jgi:SulP family sulfate permease
MFMVVIGTFAWQTLKIMRRIPLTDAMVIVLVTGRDRGQRSRHAVVVGVIVSALAYAWNNASASTPNAHHAGRRARSTRSRGRSSSARPTASPNLRPGGRPADGVIVDFMNSRVVDQSALQAIEDLAAKYEAQGKTLVLRHLSRDCHRCWPSAGQLMVDSDDDPDYELAVDYSVRTGAFGGGH